jgi:5S rRNA maturation endonuclease (ribonuclease M5)
LLGIDPAEYLFLGSRRRNSSGPGVEVARYRYTDEQGNALFDSVRFEPKDFRLYPPGQSSGGIRGVPRVLYRLPEVVAALRAGEPVLVVEGEKDADRLVELGLCATTSPMGAGKWGKVDSSPLAGASVVILPDNDEAGRGHAGDVRADLKARGCDVSVVELPGLPDKGDVSDWLDAGGTAERLQERVEEVEAGDRFADVDHIQPVDLSALGERVQDRDQWFIEPVLPRGRRVSIFSAAGVGKSLLNLFMAASVATGRAVLHRPVSDPVHVVYVDSEMTEDDLFERLEDMGFDPTNDPALQTHLHYYLHPHLPPLDTQEGGRMLLQIAQRDHAEYVFIDTVTSQTGGGENDADTYRNMGRYTSAPLVAAGIGSNILDHEGKDPSRGPRGSSGKGDPADVIWQLTRGTGNNYRLQQKKRRMAWVPESLHLELEIDPLRFTLPAAQIGANAVAVVRLLDELGISVEWGRGKVREALKEAGERVANAALTEAIAWRKRHGQSQRTGENENDGQVLRSADTATSENPYAATAGQVSRSGADRPSVPFAVSGDRIQRSPDRGADTDTSREDDVVAYLQETLGAVVVADNTRDTAEGGS